MTIIAARILQLRQPGGVVEVPVHVQAPVEDADGTWWCHYDIGWPDGARQQYAGGVDAVQALLLALQMIGSELYASDFHATGMLAWLEPGKGYGFPVAKTLRDRLIGDDAKFE